MCFLRCCIDVATLGELNYCVKCQKEYVKDQRKREREKERRWRKQTKFQTISNSQDALEYQ